MIKEFINAVQTEVDNHSIYVWGGSGQLCCQVTEAWIRSMEHNRKPDMAVQEWKEVMASPYKDVARCFDCSGYVSYCLMKLGILNHRTDCDGLFARCQEVYTPTDGTLLFRVNPANKRDETHVGIYFNGNQYHAKGRAYGVVCEDYNEKYWQKLGWFRALKPDEPPAPPAEKKVIVVGKPKCVEWDEPKPDTHEYVEVRGGSVRVREGNGTMFPSIGTAHRGDLLPCYGQADADPYWYEVDYNGRRGFISCNKRYTEIVNKI